MTMADVRIDEVLRHRVKPMRGFQLLSFGAVHDPVPRDRKVALRSPNSTLDWPESESETFCESPVDLVSEFRLFHG